MGPKASRTVRPDTPDGALRTAGGSPKPSPWQTLWPVVRPWRWYILAGILINAIHGVGLTFQIFSGTYFIDWVLKAPVEDGEKWKRVGLLAGGYVLAAAVVRMLSWHLGFRILTWVREKMVLDLRARFFRHVNHLCLKFHMRTASGELFSYLFGSPLGKVMEFYQHVSLNLPGSIVYAVSAIVLVFFWNIPVSFVLLLLVVGSVVLMNRARRKMQAIHRDFQETESAVSGEVAELLRGTKAVKIYAMEKRLDARFQKTAAGIGEKSYRRDVRSHMLWMGNEGFGYVAYGLLMVVCAWAYMKGTLTLGQVTGYLVAYNNLQGPLQALYNTFSLWGGAQASLERIGSVLAEETSTPDPEQPVATVPSASVLAVEGVSFCYRPGTPVLDRVQFEIRPGERIALVGPSGSGKSTLAQLMLRLYDPDGGRITLGGIDLRRYRQQDLRRHFGVVPQDPFLFRGSIRENVVVARPEATDSEVRAALERAHAWEFVEAMDDGIHAAVGEGGSTLSGGQKQRLAIARAILADPPVFILDEATSALDSLSERLIQEFLETGLTGRTLVLIAHRLSTVRFCDRIVVLEHGRLVQLGGFEKLMAEDGLFRRMVEGQSLRQ